MTAKVVPICVAIVFTSVVGAVLAEPAVINVPVKVYPTVNAPPTVVPPTANVPATAPGEQSGPVGMPPKQGCDAVPPAFYSDCMTRKINEGAVRAACLSLKLANDRAVRAGLATDKETRYELDKCAAAGNLDIPRR
jgi:hypothetical protein